MDNPDRHSRYLIPLLLLAMSALFVFALLHLFTLRFKSGEVYPRYSSFRADPLGTRVYYEALASMPNLTVSRRLEPLTNLKDGANTTLILCGGQLTKKEPLPETEALERFSASGGRLLVAFYPERELPKYWQTDEEEKSEWDEKCGGEGEGEGDSGEPKNKQKEEEDSEDEEFVSLEERWGFRYAFEELPNATDEALGTVTASKQGGADYLPSLVSWHSGLYFSELDPAWTVLYGWEGHPVIVERSWDNGHIVLCSDSYFLSNEAMRKDQQPGLLAWLIGPSTIVLFNETHLGISEKLNTMTLIRQYRLHYFVMALIVIGILFVWKNASSLVPKQELLVAESTTNAGRDAASGLVNLLRRSIPSRKIIAVCSEEWQRSFVNHPRKQDVRAVTAETELAPTDTYTKICDILAERKRP